MLQHHPQLAPAAEALGVRNADCQPYSDGVVSSFEFLNADEMSRFRMIDAAIVELVVIIW